jgi:hypothetical protein
VIQDVLDIQRLASDYCWCADHRNVEGIVALFTEDACFDARPMGLSLIQGHVALRDFFGTLLPMHEYSHHLCGNFRIDIQQDTACGTCHYLMLGAIREEGAISAAGYFDDTYVRTPDGWRIASRRGAPLVPPKIDPMTNRFA